jgi:hypothetical protein
MDQITRPGFRVQSVTQATTLLDPVAYPAESLADLYRVRCGAETNLARLETTLGMDELRRPTWAGVLKESVMFTVVYNLVRVVMLEAGRRQGVTAERVRFIDALRWLAEAHPGRPWPWVVVNPVRPDRVEPRCQKRRAKQYPYMIRSRAVLRKHLTEEQLLLNLMAFRLSRTPGAPGSSSLDRSRSAPLPLRPGSAPASAATRIRPARSQIA